MKPAPLLSMDALRDVVAQLPDDRFTAKRLEAVKHLEDHGTPTLRDENWKYTDLGPAIQISNEWLAAGAQTEQPADADAIIESIRTAFDAHWLVVINGSVRADSVARMRVPGLEVELLSESESIPKFDAPLMDLNVALLRDGLHIRVEAGATLHKPVGILVIDSAMSIAGLSQINVEIELQRNSEANFIEYHASTGTSDHYANSVVKLALAENASASYVRVQDRARTHKQTGRLAARLSHDSRFRHCGFDFGGQLIRNDLNIQLDGHGASAAFDGLYLAGRDQHIDNHTRIDHNVGPATSRQEYRGIVGGAARCVWNGKAVVHSGADGTDAEQANHNLLLSDDSEIDAKPELEIYADEVKCSHGTTIGQLDEAGIFYLRTRGLDRRAAEQLVTRAFAQTIVLKSPLPEIRDAISVLVDKRLDELSHGDDR